ncbi:MAG: protein-methionine-sulfoxide reductase heme-binding subunit MsrQ [Bauldia sp.]
MAPTKTIAARVPWNDKAGRFAPLKATTLVLVSLPALWLLYRTLFIGLGPRPLIEAIHKLGDWTIYFLLITLAVTPARRLFEWSKLIQVRRILGLTALFYILTHFTFFIIDSKWNLVFVAQEIVLRIYLTIGFTAILGLVALGVTSTDAMVRRLGAVRWNRLHRIVYVIGGLGLLHYYMQAKADVTQPVLMSGFFFWLMGYRIMARFGYKQGLVPLAVLSLAAALLTALAEALWYGFVRTGIPFTRVILANLDFAYQVRPAWWVLLAGLAVTTAAEIKRRLGSSRPHPRAASAT